MSLKIECLSFDKLLKEEKENVPNNGCGKEYSTYIKITENGETILLESDAIEPEDASFCRDLSWVIKALRLVYKKGKLEGEK